jgi:TolB-like protein
VEVFPFSSIGDAGHKDWIGKGIQENLQTDVSQTGALLVVVPQGQPGSTDPVAVAKQNGANLAVIGSYQLVDDQVRVNGHLIDATNGATVGSFAATGPEKDLFKLEDALGEQLRRLLPLPAVDARAEVQSQQPGQGTTAGSTPPPVIYSQPEIITSNNYSSPVATPYYYPDSFYPSYYGYDYPYDGFYGGIDVAPFVYYGGFGGYGFGYRGYGGYRAYGGGYGGGLRANPGFHNPVYRGGGSVGGFHGGGGGGFHGGGGGFHGGGGGGRR